MTTEPFTQDDLMDLLVTAVGLPAADRTDDPDAVFTDTGLDSLAFLQLQTELQLRHGVVLDESLRADEVRLGEVVALVDAARAGSRGAAQGVPA